MYLVPALIIPAYLANLDLYPVDPVLVQACLYANKVIPHKFPFKHKTDYKAMYLGLSNAVCLIDRQLMEESHAYLPDHNAKGPKDGFDLRPLELD